MEGNGSLCDCGKEFKDVCERNMLMREKARKAVQAFRLLSLFQRDVAKMIGRMVWETRTEVKTWAGR